MPNHAGYVVKVVGGGYEIVQNCTEYDSEYFARHIEIEKQLGLR
jgi:hypothetical protein